MQNGLPSHLSNLNDLEHGFSNKDDINDSNENADILPLFVNNKK